MDDPRLKILKIYSINLLNLYIQSFIFKFINFFFFFFFFFFF